MHMYTLYILNIYIYILYEFRIPKILNQFPSKRGTPKLISFRTQESRFFLKFKENGAYATDQNVCHSLSALRAVYLVNLLKHGTRNELN